MSKQEYEIVLPLWDHITKEEAQELADDIEHSFGLSLKPIVLKVER
jgi:hypothetical protein